MMFYRGMGYGPEFVENAKVILRQMRRNVELEVVEGCDDVCTACPHRVGSECWKPGVGERVYEMDRRVLEKLQLKTGNRLKAKKVARVLKAELKEYTLRSLCENCEWISICLDRLRSTRRIHEDCRPDQPIHPCGSTEFCPEDPEKCIFYRGGLR